MLGIIRAKYIRHKENVGIFLKGGGAICTACAFYMTASREFPRTLPNPFFGVPTEVHGIVTDEQKRPIPGVDITVNDKKDLKESGSNEFGQFSITVEGRKTELLTFSFKGEDYPKQPKTIEVDFSKEEFRLPDTIVLRQRVERNKSSNPIASNDKPAKRVRVTNSAVYVKVAEPQMNAGQTVLYNESIRADFALYTVMNGKPNPELNRLMQTSLNQRKISSSSSFFTPEFYTGGSFNKLSSQNYNYIKSLHLAAHVKYICLLLVEDELKSCENMPGYFCSLRQYSICIINTTTAVASYEHKAINESGITKQLADEMANKAFAEYFKTIAIPNT